MKGIRLDHRYVIREQLGEGGMATIWLAWDLRLRRRVAVKVLTGLGPDPDLESIRRFEREAQVLAGLTSPHLVTVHDTGRAKVTGRTTLYLVMDRVDGESLDKVLARGLPSPAEVARWGQQVCAALHVAHEARVVHRDLKPGNVMLATDGNVQVLDFGIAALLDHTALTRTNQVPGTPAYMSPEQAKGGQVDARSDLYSLGCTLYALLTGQPPFVANQWHILLNAHLNEQPMKPSLLRADLPQELDTLILQLLAKRPEHRPATAAEVADRLQGLTTDRLGTLSRVAVHHDTARQPANASAATKVLTNEERLPLLSPGSRQLIIGIGWDWPRVAESADGPDEPGVAVVALGFSRKVASDRHLVFAKNRTSPDGAIRHNGERPSQTGDYRGIDLDLAALPWHVRQVRIVLHAPAEALEAYSLNQVRGCYLRVSTAVARDDWAYVPWPTGPPAAAAVLGSFHRRRGSWAFKAGGRLYRGGLSEVAARHRATLESPAERNLRQIREAQKATRDDAPKTQRRRVPHRHASGPDFGPDPATPLYVVIALFYIALAIFGIWLVSEVMSGIGNFFSDLGF